jgi:hypothetical protein
MDGRMNGVDLLNKPVAVRGIELGRVVDVILDESGKRPIGLDVLCGDGAQRFVPFATVRVDAEEIEVDSPLTILDGEHLDFYRSRGRALRSSS